MDTSHKIGSAKVHTASSFQRFCFENQTQQSKEPNSIEEDKSETGENKSSVCTFLEKVQAIFIDEISGALISENESSRGKGKNWVIPKHGRTCPKKMRTE